MLIVNLYSTDPGWDVSCLLSLSCSWFNSINCKSDKTQLLDRLIKACWEIQLEAGASSNDRKKKKNEARREQTQNQPTVIIWNILSLNIFYLMLFLCLQGSRGADEKVTLGDCKETGREHLMIAGSGSQLISDIRDKIITGCQSQGQGLSLGPGNIGPSAVCSQHLSPALLVILTCNWKKSI